MERGILYLMTTVVPGLVKIGKTGINNFEGRMNELEHNGYRNVTGLMRCFAIEVNDYDDKEKMLHTIFEKSRVSDTELFALDINVAIQLLSSFDGTVIYPQNEEKEEIFEGATDIAATQCIPNGNYSMKRTKKADAKKVSATVVFKNGNWTLLKGSTLALNESKGLNNKERICRSKLPIDDKGVLLEDFELGECSPSFVSDIVIYGSSNGWDEWKNEDGQSINIFRKNIID